MKPSWTWERISAHCRAYAAKSKKKQGWGRRPVGLSRAIRTKLTKERAPACSICDLGREYNGRPLSLQLDHEDGDWANNTPDNLRWLCPNCHSQTETYAGRNKRRGQAP